MLYQQTTITGTQYTRCHNVTIENPLDGTPLIQYHEQCITTLEHGQIVQNKGYMLVEFDADKPIALRNPETGELTGEVITQGEIQTALFSSYIQAALDRDARMVDNGQTNTELGA